MWRHYIYEHRRRDTNEVFYVGKGAFRKNRRRTYERAYERSLRNSYWQRVVAKAGGFTVDIVAHCQTDEDACIVEIQRIAMRRADGMRLCNLTDGGEGRRNGVFSPEELVKRSAAAKGPRSEAWIKAIRIARKNGGNGGVVKRRDKLPDWWKERIRAKKFGAMNPMFGRRGEECHTSRKVIDSQTSIVYHSVTAAAVTAGVPMKSLYNMLTGFRKNRTSLRFANGT